MSILKIASLVVTPNAYEESKLLAVVPSNGLGDLDFVRASTKTRVNSEGFVESTPYNLISNSNNFSSNIFGANGTRTFESNITAPDGSLGVFKIRFNNLSGTFLGLGAFQAKNVSIFAKAVAVGVNDNFQFFSVNGSTSTRNVATENWTRFNFNTTHTGATEFYINNGDDSYITDIYIWGSQITEGLGVKPYLPTTNRLNVPSIDYTGGGCPSILLEPQRTNLAIYSNDFTNSNWVKSSSLIINTNLLSPSNELFSSKFIDDSTNNVHQIRTTFSSVTGFTYTNSIFVKGEQRHFVIRLRSHINTGNEAFAVFNTITKTVGSTGGTVWVPTANVVNFGNGWYRYSLTTTVAESATLALDLMLSNSSTAIQSYSGDGSAGLNIWGPQLEQGAYATSYIPTQASAVTRIQDQLSKTGISNLIGQTEGVLFIESAALFTDSLMRAVTLSDGTTSNRIQFRYESSSNNVVFALQSNGGDVSFLSTTFSDVTQFSKVAIRYSLNDVSIWVNGVKVITNNTIVLPLNLNKLSFDNGTGNLQFNAKVNSLLLFKTYLSDDEMQLLGTTSYNTYQEMATALNYVTQ
jgi:hypothetical protein